ncbi:LPS-assembly protein LptD [Coraliomargarita akajimensis]|uniref:Organic solvent tolerance protein n=1 Tax=Coraliomargarita akajimensis (strain DSM 45221 / IAM 15411 / JCM 23193 / KCTC 12865 / 04OKA010-24) TaxID=583355 RepID=D5EQW2_CORAD|nr:LPS-assembly protein LptD [Coraliomargarita akajimensis]ADE53955.1 Organic solvent tolerance protein [Coraliomargarita akajimensis DSM 45221]
MLRIARLTTLFFCFKLTLQAALPEISSIEPIEFDEASQRLVARGDARLDFDGTRLQADRITYYQDFGLADAEGSVQISREGYRLLAERVSYDTQGGIYSVNIFRTGSYPYYISGVTAGGTTEQSNMSGTSIYYGDPGDSTISISAREVTYMGEDRNAAKLDGATFRMGRIPFFYLPSYTHYLDQPPYYIDLDAGYDNTFGAYLQTTTLFPVTSWLRAGLNLDVYTERGLLVGPTAQYVYDTDSQRIKGAISTGYISDQGDTGVDVLGNPIAEDRGFVEWRHQHHIGQRITLTASTSYWSDSEVTRDFRDGMYADNRRPDNFVEGAYAGDNYILSAFSRFDPNDFNFVQERLPEVRLDVLPVNFFNTNIYQRGSVSYVRLSEDGSEVDPASVPVSESDRIDLNYRIERPFAFTEWLTLTPLAGARLTHYDNQQVSATLTPVTDETFTRSIFEFGFDLESRAYADYETLNRTWDVDGLRHVIRPVVQYRYFSDPEDDGEIAEIDRWTFDTTRSIIDLNELRNTDQIDQEHMVRVGFENLFQTRASNQDYGSRNLAALNFYQDILFEKNSRFDNPAQEEETFDATWVELLLTPAPWLKFNLASRFHTESVTLEEIRTRTTITSGEIWELSLQTDMLNKVIDQYAIDFLYRVNERYTLLTDARIDADTGEITRTRIGIATRWGSVWQILYSLTFREEAQRESDIQFSVSLRMLAL